MDSLSEPRQKPPHVTERFVEWSLPQADREAVLGDLQEEFAQKVAVSGRRSACGWYIRQALASIGPNYTRRIVGEIHHRQDEESESDRMMRRTVRKVSLSMLAVPVASCALVWSSNTREDVSFVIAVVALCGWLGVVLFVGSLFPTRRPSDSTRRRVKFFSWLWLFSAFCYFVLNPDYVWLLRGLRWLELLAALIIYVWPKDRWPIAPPWQSPEENSRFHDRTA